MFEQLHIQYFLGAFISLLTVSNPPSKIPLFVSLTLGMSPERKINQARMAAIYSAAVMLLSLAGGNFILSFFGISYGALRIAGGIVVAAIGFQMLMGGASKPNQAPLVRRDREDYAFFPLAMPGIAGPGTIAVVIGISTEIVELDDVAQMCTAFAWTILAILAVSAGSWAVMRYADLLTHRLGASGSLVLGKFMGFMLICIGVQFIGSGARTFFLGQ